MRPPAPSSTPAGRDFYANDKHRGSPNLGEFPASHDELQWAGRLYASNCEDMVAAKHLRDLTGSARRAMAVLRYVRRAAEAADMVKRITPEGGQR